MQYGLRLTGAQHAALRSHLFPGDGKEAVALLLCGRRFGKERHIMSVREVVPVSYAECTLRAFDRVTWDTGRVDALVDKAYGKRLAIVKVHSHPQGFDKFSQIDDESDASLFASIHSLLGDELPHGSVVMLPDGAIFGRILQDGVVIAEISSLMAVGDDIRRWSPKPNAIAAEFGLRHTQAFGLGTFNLLRDCSAAVVGCSGTGSIVVEQLARLGIGRLVLIDPDEVEEKNLNRILNSKRADAVQGRPKVQVLAAAIAGMDLGTEVLPFQTNLACRDAVLATSECDFLFGCMDGVEGRHLLNRIATFYTLPYFDVGVRLDADGHNGISNISGAVHYLQPGASSLLSRGLYDMTQVEAEELRRTDPDLFEFGRKEGYLRGVVEDRPAVISVNMFYAALCVNEFLARLHPYRNNPNADYAYVGASLTEVQMFPESEGLPCQALHAHVGKGDIEPLLGRPSLS